MIRPFEITMDVFELYSTRALRLDLHERFGLAGREVPQPESDLLEGQVFVLGVHLRYKLSVPSTARRPSAYIKKLTCKNLALWLCRVDSTRLPYVIFHLSSRT